MKTRSLRHGILFSLLASLAFALPARSQSFEPRYVLNKVPGSAADAGNVLAYGAAPGNGLGSCVRAGDLNGDGIEDLIVGAYPATVGAPARSMAGAVYVWFGKGNLAGTKDVAGTNGTPPDLTILGASPNDQMTYGGAIAVADVNGDGTVDLILGARGAGGPANGRPGAGEVYVVFGRQSPATFSATLDLAIQGSAGADVTIYGAAAGDSLSSNGAQYGAAIAIGDFNGDGVADMILGAATADAPGRMDAGKGYLILGRLSPASFPATLDLSLAGAADAVIVGATAGDNLTNDGTIRLGDFNDDGLDDILLGAWQADGPGEARSSAGEAYIVFGRQNPGFFPAALDLALHGSGGADVTIYGATGGALGDRLTWQAELAVGDVNGDGTADIILGAVTADGPGDGRTDAGEAYIIFGRKSPSLFPLTLDMATQGSAGADVIIYGASSTDDLGSGGALTTADVNGDGTADILLGALNGDGAAGGAGDNRGEAYIVFGRKSPSTFPATLDLAVQGNAGANVTIYGVNASTFLTSAGTSAGDITGDGAAEFILVDSSRVYIVLGQKSPASFPTTITLSTLGSAGSFVALSGGQNIGSTSHSGFGDVNGDGIRDLLVGAPSASALGRGTGTGEAYVLYGIAAPSPEITIEQPAGTALSDGLSTIDFGTVNPGSSSAAKTFVVKNTGTAALSITGVNVIGANAVEFAANTAGMLASVPAGQQTTFSVTFTPSAGGPRSATLQLMSDDTDEAIFDIALTGAGTLSIAESWRLQYFGTTANAGNAADAADPDFDGWENSLERALDTDPTKGETGPIIVTGNVITPGAPTILMSGPNILALYARRKDYVAAGLTYTPQFSADLAVWIDSIATPTLLADDGVMQALTVPFPMDARFLRLKIVDSSALP